MVVVIEELALVDRVVDLFADTRDLTVEVKLADDVWACLALTEGDVLVDGLLRVRDDVLESERTELHPSVSSLLARFTERVVVGEPVEFLGQSRLERSLRCVIRDLSHVDNFWIREAETVMTNWRGGIVLKSSRGEVLIGLNTPVFAFLEELLFIIWIEELWQKLSFVSQVINEMLESFAISIEENFVIDDLELVKTTKHSFEQ